jgi:probable rRNA maturation factor
MSGTRARRAQDRKRVSVEVDVQRAVDHYQGFLPSDQEIERWVGAALGDQREHAEVTVRLVDEDEGTQLNEAFRGKRGPTNVLSFPFEAPPGVDLALLGDIVVCAPVVAREARSQGKTPVAQWAHMVVHGTLHLLGYDHIDPPQAARMEALEISILEHLGYPNPYANADADD